MRAVAVKASTSNKFHSVAKWCCAALPYVKMYCLRRRASLGLGLKFISQSGGTRPFIFPSMNPSPNLSANHFELFGLPAQFALAGDAIDHSYRDMQARVHPDRFASASDAERRLSMQWATRVN